MSPNEEKQTLIIDNNPFRFPKRERERERGKPLVLVILASGLVPM